MSPEAMYRTTIVTRDAPVQRWRGDKRARWPAGVTPDTARRGVAPGPDEPDAWGLALSSARSLLRPGPAPEPRTAPTPARAPVASAPPRSPAPARRPPPATTQCR